MGVGFPSLISTCPQKTDRLHWAIGGGSGGFVGRDVGIDRGDVGKELLKRMATHLGLHLACTDQEALNAVVLAREAPYLSGG